jgi:hypothetical protein
LVNTFNVLSSYNDRTEFDIEGVKLTNNKGRIEVLVTDGSEIRRLLWVERRPNGIYSGSCGPDGFIHSTYHEDGNRFMKIRGKLQQIGSGQKLSEFKGIFHLGQIAYSWMGKIIITLPSYNFRKIDSVIYIDMRNYENGLDMDYFLLEPSKLELLNQFCDGLRKDSQIHIFTSVEPWVVISYRPSKQHNGTKQG